MTDENTRRLAVIVLNHPDEAQPFTAALNALSEKHGLSAKHRVVNLSDEGVPEVPELALFDAARHLAMHGVEMAIVASPELFEAALRVQQEISMPLVTPESLLDDAERLSGLGRPALFSFGELPLAHARSHTRTGFVSGEVTGGDIVEAASKLLDDNTPTVCVAGVGSVEIATLLQRAGLPALAYPVLAMELALTQKPVARPLPFKIGVIGGLGPAATVDLYDKITKATPAKTDQTHIRVAIEQNPQIPDRTTALLKGGEDPTLAMYACAKRLETDGCDAVVVACNTAHAFLPAIAKRLAIPFIDMQVATMEEIKAKLGTGAKIGLLATSGTVASKLYHRRAEEAGLELYTPDEAHQALVMNAIYGPEGAKAGFTTGTCWDELKAAADFLVRGYGCQALILGCTELPLIMSESDAFPCGDTTVVMVDPTSALARKIVRVAMDENKARGH